MTEQLSFVVGDTLKKARDTYHKELRAGHSPRCPCCDRQGKIYRRKLHAEMAAFLIRLVRLHDGEPRWFHIREVLAVAGAKAATDGSYLQHWQLIEKKDDNDVGKKGGMYRPTAKGIAFARGEQNALSHVLLYDNKLIGFSSVFVSIREALGEKFNYEELMKGGTS